MGAEFPGGGPPTGAAGGDLAGSTFPNPILKAGVALVPTAVKTSSYTAVAGDLIPVDATSGAVAIQLPTAPADRTRIMVKKVDSSTNLVTINRGGSDVFNTAGGGTSLTLTLQFQASGLQYASASGIWFVVSDDLALSRLDSRYSNTTDTRLDVGRRALLNEPWADPCKYAYGGVQVAVCKGVTHPLSEIFSTLGAAQAIFPLVTSLAQERDFACFQQALNELPGDGDSQGRPPGGAIVVSGHYFFGADTISSSKPGVAIIGMAGQFYAFNSTLSASAITSTSLTNPVFTLGQSGSTENRGWIFRDLTVSDGNVAGGCPGGFRLVRFNNCRFDNVQVDNMQAGYWCQLDGTGDTCQYTKITDCRGRRLLNGITFVQQADDTEVLGGNFFGTRDQGGTGVGLQLGSSMRSIGTNCQNFATVATLDGNEPTVSELRCDSSGSVLPTVFVDVLGTAKDAKIICGNFGGSTPSTAFIRVNAGAIRTQIIAPSTNQALSAVTIDNGTDTTYLSWADGLVLKGDAKLTRAAGGTLKSANGFVTKTKAGTISDADFSAAPPDGTLGVNTSTQRFAFRANGAWNEITIPAITPGGAGGLQAAIAEASIANSTTETVLAVYTIAAGSAAAGTVYRLTASGNTDTVNSSGTLTLRARIGGVAGVNFFQAILPTAATGAATKPWYIDTTLTFRVIGGSGRVAGMGIALGALGTTTTVSFFTPNTPGSNVNTASGLDFVLTAQWATADPGNVCRLEAAVYEQVKS